MTTHAPTTEKERVEDVAATLDDALDDLEVETGLRYLDYTPLSWLTRHTLAAVRSHPDDDAAVASVLDLFHDEVIRQHQQPTHCRGQRTLRLPQ